MVRFSCVRWSQRAVLSGAGVLGDRRPADLLMPRWGIITIAQCWARSSIWLMRVICNTKVEYRGVEKIPKGPLIVASKHQSMWETFALLQFFPEPLYILKRELKWIPFFGWYLVKTNMIGVVRGAGGRSLIEMARRAGEEVRRGRQLIIFPEGTRTAVDAPPRYKTGVAQVYVDCGVPCLRLRSIPACFGPPRLLRLSGRSWSNFSICCRPASHAVNSSRRSRP